MQMVTMRNWKTGKMDTFDLDALTDDDASMYIPRDDTPLAHTSAEAIYQICRHHADTPREALTNALMSVLSGKYEGPEHK